MTHAQETRMRNSHQKLAQETRTRHLHEIEHALFDARNLHEKYLAASRYDTLTSFSHESRELTHTSFSYVCHGLKIVLISAGLTLSVVCSNVLLFS